MATRKSRPRRRRRRHVYTYIYAFSLYTYTLARIYRHIYVQLPPPVRLCFPPPERGLPFLHCVFGLARERS